MSGVAPALASRAPAEAAPAPTPSRHRESPRVRASLKISAPGDSAEREAKDTARRVVAMPAVGLGPIARRIPLMAARAPVVPVPRPQARAEAMPPPAAARPPDETSPELEAAIRTEVGGGRPLPVDVAEFMAPRFRANFDRVRIHTDARAASLTTRLGARAFTFGRDIFFNAGQFRPQEPEGMELIAHELTHTIQQREIVQREVEPEAAPVEVTQTSAPRVQRGLISEALDWFADRANLIPGFRLFTVVIGLNPINMSRVERSGANILRALVEFLPGGGLIVEALDRYGIFERAGSFIEQQFRTLGMVGGMFRDALMRFLDSLSWRDVFRLGSVWERARRIFTEPVVRLIDFGRSLVTGVLRFIREAILRPLAALAEGTRGYPLLKAVLGQDPVTGEPVARTPDALIGGFMTLIGQREIWENIKRANAIPRAWAWFQTALSGLMGLVRSIPGRFMDTLRSLEIMDLVLPPRAFLKVGRAFASFIGDFLSWAGGTVLDLLQIIFEVVAQRAVPYVRRAAGAFRTIIRDPIRFIGTLVRAGIQGFRQFGRNFLGHLRTALIQWLTGAMAGTNIYIPASFSLMEIVKFILSVLGLTWTNIRAKLVRATNETVVSAMETGFEIVRTLVTQGPAAAWEQIVQSLTNLRDMVIEQVMTYVKDRIISVAIQTLVTSLNPAGAFIQAIIAIYNTIMFFIERLNQIAQVAASFIDSIAAIAAGTIGPAANRVERTMAGLLVLVISFLARIARLGNVSQIVTRFLDRVRAPIDRGLDRVVDWIVARARALGRFVAQAGVPHDPAERLRLAARAAVAAARRLSGRVTAPMLELALAAVRVRYGLTTIAVFRRGSSWWARAQINPVLEQDLGVPTEGPAVAGGARWDAAVAAVRQDLARMEGEGVTDTDLQNAIPGWIRQHGFRTLTIITREEEYQINGTMNPAGAVATVPKSGTRRNPFRLDWPKPPSANYVELYFGGIVNARRAQSALKGLFNRGAADGTGTLVQQFFPNQRKALPGGGTVIGLTAPYRVNVNSIIGPLSTAGTPGGSVLLDVLWPYGFDSTYEARDADHVREMQLGGVNLVQNMWPLDSGINRGAGPTLAQATVLYPTSGKSTTIAALKAKISPSNRYFFRITSCR